MINKYKYIALEIELNNAIIDASRPLPDFVCIMSPPKTPPTASFHKINAEMGVGLQGQKIFEANH